MYNQYFASRTRLERSRAKLRPKTGPKSTQSSCIYIYIATAPVIPSANTWLHTDSYITIVQSLERTLGAEPEWASGSERRRGYARPAAQDIFIEREIYIYIERERERERERETLGSKSPANYNLRMMKNIPDHRDLVDSDTWNNDCRCGSCFVGPVSLSQIIVALFGSGRVCIYIYTHIFVYIGRANCTTSVLRARRT